MAFSSSTIEVPLAVQRARENQVRRYAAYLQRSLDGGEPDDNEEEEAEVDTCWSWCVCMGALLVNTFLIGIHHAYSVLFIAFRREYGLSYDTASWLGSLSYGFSSFLGPFSGLVFHKIGHRACATIGTFIAVAGLLGCSFAHSVTELAVSYVFLFGLGSSLSYTPSVVVSNPYFDRHLGLATGIVMSGTMIGGMILPPVAQVLLTSVGYRATMRVLAGIGCLGFVGASTFSGRERLIPTNQTDPGRPRDVTVYLRQVRNTLRDPVYCVWVSCIMLVHLGSMTPIIHLVQRGLDIGLSFGEASSAVSLMSVASALGRIGFGRVLDHPRVSQRLMAQLSIFVMGLSLILVPAVVNLPLMLAFALVYGAAEGLYVDLMPLTTLRLMGPRGTAEIAWTLLVGMVSIPWIIGPFVAGILRETVGSYDLAFILCGAVIVAAAGILFALPLALRRREMADGSPEGAGDAPAQLTQASFGAPIFGYISIQDMPPSYRQQIRFRPGKTTQLQQGLGPGGLQSTAQTISNLEIQPLNASSRAHNRWTASRSQEVVSRPLPLEYDSLAALRRNIPSQRPGAETTPQPEPAAPPAAAPSTSKTLPPPPAALPPPVDQVPAGYEALPVAGYLVLEPGSDQARFVVVDSRAGQTLMMRTSLTPGPADVEDESDDRLRQVLETIAEESRSNIAVVDGGEGASTAHERFRQVRRAVTGWHAYAEADEAEVTSLTESRSVEAATAGSVTEQETAPPRPASLSSMDVRPTAATAASLSDAELETPEQRSVSPSDITLSGVADSQEWHEPRPGSAMSDRARSADTRRRRSLGLSLSLSRGGEARPASSDHGSLGSVSSAEEADSSTGDRPYY
ncbi:uncharacterized protein LOC122374666 isoform X1 [Amphibalanus amphitrite]|nr:uncharacterized protein LOC122374666 isoform X1 [Amphibalanus amphitrite]